MAAYSTAFTTAGLTAMVRRHLSQGRSLLVISLLDIRLDLTSALTGTREGTGDPGLSGDLEVGVFLAQRLGIWARALAHRKVVAEIEVLHWSVNVRRAVDRKRADAFMDGLAHRQECTI